MTAVFCENAADRSAETWGRQLARFERLEFAISDGAKGIAKAASRLAQARRDDPQAPTLEHGLDVFHTTMEARRVLVLHWRRAEAAWEKAEAADLEVATTMEARRVLVLHWRRAEAAWEKAEAADLEVARSKQQGIDARGAARAAWHAWGRAIASFEQVERREAAWRRAHAALDLFGAEGRLIDRRQAELEIAEALKDLGGDDWSKVRNFLKDRRSLSFLDRMHRRLESAEPDAEARRAMGWRWWLRHRRGRGSGPLVWLIQAVGRERELTGPERASYDRVSAVLSDTYRASSAVECMNSVLRMQQSRHKRMTQPMLDLKRLYWNCHTFGAGPREKACPYEILGLDLPTFDFWKLLQADPGELTQRLSTAENAE